MNTQLNKIKNCYCGSNNVEFVKLYKKNRYDGFIRCNHCNYEGRLYTSKQNAIKAWNKVMEGDNYDRERSNKGVRSIK